MANEILVKVGTQISFADHAGDFSPASGTSLEVGTPINVQLALASVANGNARQSAKVDLGATRARDYTMWASIEMAATPTTGEVINFHWCASPQSTAGNGNPGYCTGVDAAYTGGVAELAEGLALLKGFIGAVVCSADATGTVQVGLIGVFSPPARYGSLVVENKCEAAFHSDDVEIHVVMVPAPDEIQS